MHPISLNVKLVPGVKMPLLRPEALTSITCFVLARSCVGSDDMIVSVKVGDQRAEEEKRSTSQNCLAD
jgi:hypothetical protein